MNYSVSVTYEFPLAPPETVRLVIAARSHGTAARLAMKAIKAAHPGRQPSSIVLVLDLDRSARGMAKARRDAENADLSV